MDEQDLRERLMAAAATDQAPPSAEADLARGRRSRRHRTMAVSATTLSATVVLGTFGVAAGLAIHRNAATPKTPSGVSDNGWAAHQPKATGSTSTLGPNRPTSKAASTSSKTSLGQSGGEYGGWTHQVFLLTRRDLDPQHHYTSYSTNIEESQTGAHHALGTRVTWQRAGESGEGMVGVLLASPGSPRYAGACTQFGPCRSAHSHEFGHYVISGDPTAGTGFEVIVKQADGEIADIMVNPLYGNNAIIPTTAPLPTLHQVLTLATDTHLDLPSQ